MKVLVLVEIPEGNTCDDCRYLRWSSIYSTHVCNLFLEDLDGRFNIPKCHKCQFEKSTQ